MQKNISQTNLTILLIVVAFIFSILVRLIWVYQVGDNESLRFNNQIMINTNDGYFWAEGAKNILSGEKALSSAHVTAPAQLTAVIAKSLPFSFESIILYITIVLASLIVIPIILIAKRLGSLEVGFISALLASIAVNYYNRTMVGYFDTDMLNVVLPMFLLWSIIWAIDTKEDKFLFIVALDVLLYRWWYPQSHSLEFSFLGLILFYTLVFERKSIYNYQLLMIFIICILDIDIFIKLSAVLGVVVIFKFEIIKKYIYYISILPLVFFFYNGGLAQIMHQLNKYVFKDAVSAAHDGGLHYYTVIQTVSEANLIPFKTFATYISGDVITFLLSVVGFGLLLYRHKIMIFSLPILGLGFLALQGGQRFTIYAIPILALGVAFLIHELSLKIKNQTYRYIFLTISTLMILYPNISHVLEYKKSSLLHKNEVIALDALKKISTNKDYTISWWDYGHSIRYYSNTRTLIDAGINLGKVSFPVSYMFTNPQNEAAKLARLEVEYKAKYKRVLSSCIEKTTKDYGYKNPNEFLQALKGDIKLPKKTRDIYFYIPRHMFNIYPTITKFSNIDLLTGKKTNEPTLFKSDDFKETKTSIKFAKGVFLNKVNSTLQINTKSVKIHRFVKATREGKKIKVKSKIVNKKEGLTIIYLKHYKTFLIVDEKTYNSTYIQLMMLDKEDKKYFEKVYDNSFAKVYKVNI